MECQYPDSITTGRMSQTCVHAAPAFTGAAGQTGQVSAAPAALRLHLSCGEY